MNKLASFLIRLVFILCTFLAMLGIYGLFSFSYGFPVSAGDISILESLSITKAFVWKNILTNAEDAAYFFVFVTRNGKAFFGSCSSNDIQIIKGTNEFINGGSFNDVSVVWFFVQPILALVALVLPYPKKKKVETSLAKSAPIQANEVVTDQATKSEEDKMPKTTTSPEPPVTPQSPSNKIGSKKKEKYITWTVVGLSIFVVAMVIIVPVAVTLANNEAKVYVSSYNDSSRAAYELGSPSNPMTDISYINDALKDHAVIDVHYLFTGSQIRTISIPNNVIDVSFINEGGSDSLRNANIEIYHADDVNLTLGITNFKGNSITNNGSGGFSLNMFFGESNDFYYPRNDNACFYLPKVDLSLSSFGKRSSIKISEANGANGSSGTNGQNPGTTEDSINGTDGTNGTGTADGIRSQSIAFGDSLVDSVIIVNTGDAGDGGNAGKAGWFLGVLGIGSHPGTDGKPGKGGAAGMAIRTSDMKVHGNLIGGSISDNGSFSNKNLVFRTGYNGKNGVVNS